MSRTYKDRPRWVKKTDPAYRPYIDHDHRNGECIEETAEYIRLSQDSRAEKPWKHRPRCKKYREEEYFCTPDNPEVAYSSIRWSRNGIARTMRIYCWRDQWVAYDEESDRYVGFVLRKCKGHTRKVYDESLPCVCDNYMNLPRPTCWVEFPDSVRKTNLWTRSSPPSSIVRERYHAPERRRSRDTLRGIAKEYNTFGDLDDITDDYFSRPARNSVKWDWY